ncbi:MAG: amino acid ABC transporter permease [Bdellovibrio sp.]
MNRNSRHGLWLKKNLFSTPKQSMVSVTLLTILFYVFSKLLMWTLFNATWSGDAEVCRSNGGFCWPFLWEKMNLILFGLYPREHLWRPILTIVGFVILMFLSFDKKRWGAKLLINWMVLGFWTFYFLRGGMLGLTYIESNSWGGLPLTLLLFNFGLLGAYPLGILLALGRRSNLIIIKWICIAFIELIRGVPLISVLFMASVLFPLFLPQGVVFEKYWRAQVAFILFMGAYMAEVVRGGLQAIPNGQVEAAKALGLNSVQVQIYIVLPQALRIVIPPTVSTAIGLFKDTSLVLIISLFDLLGSTKSALKDASWLGFSVEAYVFVGLIYYFFCSNMSRLSRKMEKELSVVKR